MIRRKRLYREAVESYRRGYIEGTQAGIFARDNERMKRLYGPCSPSDHESAPAHSAGYDYGYHSQRVGLDRLPLDVWVRVLAKAQEPT